MTRAFRRTYRRMIADLRASARAWFNGVQRAELLASSAAWARMSEMTARVWC
jgi:hypothetical protein